MSNENPINESDIATAAARVLHESFIKAAHSGTILYVENDALMSKTPNCKPVFVKQLSGRNPDLAKLVVDRGTYKIKKRNVKASTEIN